MQEVRVNKTVGAGLVFIAFAIAFAFGALQLDLGTLSQLGPGYFPFAMAMLLLILGVVSLVEGLRKPDVSTVTIPWRPIIMIVVALLFFGSTIRGLGLMPTLFLTIFAAAMADKRNTLLSATCLSAVMSVFSWLVFKVGLGAVVPTFGPWLVSY
ncbi:tripartite tricarboxylate transporter TctB family protein [Salipiger abyssi]|uniref:Tripartite tricarboxylate transporter TctB family protein n=1 Tax=Salipiger abyssi TaxID=1250539 RepID=A0A1P8UMT7_9RHOB|nr:tripartite tricarboxylate transporter TctB family protein [Salipiger abyssi]APZ50675.1 Tripartite tricarboxylate transporter TctB family protein [Salipiger abyssi]